MPHRPGGRESRFVVFSQGASLTKSNLVRTLRVPDVQFFQPLAHSRWKRHPPLCHPEDLTCLWQVKGAMTMPPAPATKVGVPHSSPVFGLEWDTQNSTPQSLVCH